MTPELWQRLKPLFHAALDRDAAERAEFIEQACADDPELKVHLHALVEAEEQGTGSVDGALNELPKLLDAAMVRFQPGQVVLDRFRIVRQIGTGGMGEVYEAEDLQLGTIALKTIRPGIASSKDAFERFRQEVQLARRVSGPQVCRIHELFLLPATDGRAPAAFLTMEYLDGTTLSGKLRQDGPLAWKEALQVALDICEGLRLIHEKGIIHRDLKSGNIMVCRQNGASRTVLMDFGLAHDFSATPSPGDATAPPAAFRTVEGAIMGTPEYMAPEQFESRPASPATDIYALGIILYELVTGVHPYSAQTPIAAAIRRAKHPKPASSVQRAVPRHWDRIIERCIEFEPEKRFQSAAEVAKALRAGPANLNNLRKDQPWVIPVASAFALGMLAWSGYLWWQARQLYHPSADARRWYDAGVAALREGNYTRATRSLDAAIAQDRHYVMAHVRMAEAWNNLDFQGNAQREMLTASAGEHFLSTIDGMYFSAIQATVAGDLPGALNLYRRILDRLPDADKPAGYVDRGMAFERVGDLPHALEDYAHAASLDPDGAASYMHTAILEARRRHIPEANRAFDQAEKIFSTELNQEGLANLEYERGYAANDGGNPALAKQFLDKALEKAGQIPSVQLEIRSLTQLSAVAYVSDRYDEAVKDAEGAIDLAQRNHLDVWAANGYVRLANARLQQGNLKAAEDAVQEAIQLCEQGQQPRTQAGADLTLASIMDQRALPDKVLAPAQGALDYYRQNGFFGPAASASLLLIRAERGKGEYSQALESAEAFQELAYKSGLGQLMTLSEEAFGTIYLEMEQYPKALERFQNARSKAEGTNAKAYQALHCADALWRLGRYNEVEQMLQSVPKTQTFDHRVTWIRIASLLSRMEFKDADALARKALTDPTFTTEDKLQLELDEAVTEAHLQATAAAIKRLDDASADANQGGDWSTQLQIAEADLTLGRSQKALDVATRAADHFASTNQPDSELRSLCIGASAAKQVKNGVIYDQFSKKALDILSQLRQTWGPNALRSYLSRVDLHELMRRASISAPLDRM